jgi:hypothetical protein
MLAVALTVILSGIMFYLYGEALEVRDQVSEEMDLLMAERLIMSRMTSELRSAMEYPFMQTGMEGEAGSASWITVQAPGRAAWVVAGLDENTVPPECDIRMVGYRLRVETDEESGEDVVTGLERTCQKILSASVAEEETEEETESAEIEVVFLTDRIKHLRLRYYDGSGWFDTWTEQDLPAAVEITLGDLPMAEEETEEEYAGKLFRRIVHVPGGRRARAGSNVRGLGGSVSR